MIRGWAAPALLAAIAWLVPGLAAGQSPLDSEQSISLDADSTDYDRRNNLVEFRGLTITQGAMRIQADYARAQQLDFDDAQWEFSGNVRIGMQQSLLVADEATLTFEGHRLTHAVARGDPATFEDRGTISGRQIEGHAGKVEYDPVNGIIRLAQNAWLSEGTNEISSNSLVYNLTEERVLAEGDGAESRVRITISPPNDNGPTDTDSDGAAAQ